jgi:hypothetical protein
MPDSFRLPPNDDAFWRDIRTVIEVPDDAFEDVIARLEAAPDFTGDPARLHEIVSSEIQNSAQEQALHNFLRLVPEWHEGYGRGADEFAREFAASVGRRKSDSKPDSKPFLTQAQVTLLEARIRRIASPDPGLDPRRRKFLARSIGRA